jgi:hypothetical protein
VMHSVAWTPERSRGGVPRAIPAGELAAALVVVRASR